MATTLAMLALIHAVALACILVMAKFSVMLVDEDGQPLQRTTGWYEQVIPSAEGVRVRVAERDR